MTSTLKVALHPSLAPHAPEVKYVFRTLLKLAGYGYEFVWSEDSHTADADIYYGPEGWRGKAGWRIAWCGKPFTEAAAIEPVSLHTQDGLAFLDFGQPQRGFHRAADDSLHFASDIILGSYWLLTGAAEHRYKRDRVDNLSLDGSFFFRNAMLEKPLVSLYAQFLREHFSQLGRVPLDRPWNGKAAAFAFTHDVDYPEMIRWIEALRLLVGSTHAPRRVLGGVVTGANHFWRFQDWVELARKYGTRPAFYFSARRGSPVQYARGTPDCFYDIRSPRFRELFRSLREEGCEIGLHASFHAFQSTEQLRHEKAALEEAAGVTVAGGRHHYWRLNPDAPHETLARHQQIGMQYDASLAFEFYPGFRRGICHPFHPFDPQTRHELDIIELPPTWMDDHFDRRLAVNGIADPAAAEPEIVERTSAYASRLLDAVRSTGGVAVVDYHVRGMNSDFFPRYGPWLARFAEEHFDSNLHFTTPAELSRQFAAYEATIDAASPSHAVEFKAQASAALEIGSMRPEEVRAVAQMHFDFFGVGEMHGHSLANLGVNFLADVFYRLNLDNPHFFVDVARYNGELVAFSVYVSDWQRILGEVIRRHPMSFVGSMGKQFLRMPIATVHHAWGNLHYLTDKMPPAVKDIRACYLLLGIKDDYRSREFRERTGRWVIGELWDRMEQTLAAAGCREFWSAPGAHNGPINRLFEKQGTEKVAQAPVQGVLCNFYRKSLQPAKGVAQ